MDSEKDAPVPAHQEEVEVQVAVQVNKEDHEMSKWQVIRRYPQPFFWSVYAIWTILLVSFDNQASGIVFGIPQFRKDFGYYYDGNYVLDAKWQSAFSGAPLASNLVSSLIAGQVSDKIGRRYTIVIALIISFAAVTLEVVADTNELFFGGKLLNGFATGTLASVCITYIGEISPLALRGLLTCMSALSYTLGPLIVAFIINTTGTYTNHWAYRSLFCAQYGFSVVSFILVWFMPESPWWLASRDRDDKALKSLQRLGYRGGEDSRRLSLIKLTLEEIRRETESVSYFECFRNSNLRRTIISIAPLSIQSLAGVVFVASYTIYYIQLGGFSDSMSFKLQITQQVCSTIGNIMSWFVIDSVGRRNLTLWGSISLMVILMVCGGCAAVGSVGTTKAAVALLLLYCWLYNLTIGATAFTILCEVPTSRLRVKTIAIGISLQNCLNLMWSFVMPYLFNPDKANLGAKVTFIFGGLSVFCVIYLWVYQPETSHRSYEELDEMFMDKIPARKFKGYMTHVEMRGEIGKEVGS
ncbi:General substrate transporter [Venustampulla echinocandica]|uniref:General substrate transporter n=1 Tax=Venustampulla echinocandica TaxID=2656787 RepID=A0A370TMQ3_9HELO|nr:General substrate transporter [Venustampulla echinocandica]RDL36806.1 General substrate transporter [Venustampulla echinocandica]